MAIEKLVTGTLIASYTSEMGSEVNSLASGSSVLSSVLIDNSVSPGDEFGQISISLGSFTTGANAPFVTFYAYELNGDGTTYGDGRFASAAAGVPAGRYLGVVPLVPSVTQVQTGATGYFLLPLAKFKLVLYNFAGGTLAASANTIYFKSLNRQVS